MKAGSGPLPIFFVYTWDPDFSKVLLGSGFSGHGKQWVFINDKGEVSRHPVYLELVFITDPVFLRQEQGLFSSFPIFFFIPWIRIRVFPKSNQDPVFDMVKK